MGRVPTGRDAARYDGRAAARPYRLGNLPIIIGKWFNSPLLLPAGTSCSKRNVPSGTIIRDESPRATPGTGQWTPSRTSRRTRAASPRAIRSSCGATGTGRITGTASRTIRQHARTSGTTRTAEAKISTRGSRAARRQTGRFSHQPGCQRSDASCRIAEAGAQSNGGCFGTGRTRRTAKARRRTRD